MSEPVRSESEREEVLRRMLAEAVAPVRPAPGAQARLLARARAAGHRRRRGFLGWGFAAVALACAAIVAVVVVGVGSGRRGGSDVASSAGGARVPGPTAVSEVPDVPNPLSPQGGPAMPAAPKDLRLGSSVAAAGIGEPLRTDDLDGDGVADQLSLRGGALLANLSRLGGQQLALPPVGPGARVLGTAVLDTVSGARVPAAFVRLSDRLGVTRDVVAAVLNGRLALLTMDGKPAVLVRDAFGTYACATALTVFTATGPQVYGVAGDRLVPSSALRPSHLDAGCLG